MDVEKAITPEEDLVISEGIASDPDTYELDAAEFAQLRRPGRPVGSDAEFDDAATKELLN